MALIGAARRRAAAHGIPCTLDADDITRRVSQGTCEATGLPFDLQRAGIRGHTRPMAPSLDRRNPWHGGYTTENVQVVCAAYNQARGRWGDDVLLMIAQQRTEHLKNKR